MSRIATLVRHDHCKPNSPSEENAISYIDGFVIAAPTANRQEVIDYAARFDPIFIEFGALRVVEAWGVDVPHGKLTDFYRAVDAKDDETVMFSWIEWPDKATRDAGMQKMMEDPRMGADNPLPFDGKRMIFGTFENVLDLKA